MSEMLTNKLDHAFSYAHEVHAGQFKKGTSVPYLGHLMGVSSIVLDDGGSEDEAVAALLHDAAEDHGGRARLRQHPAMRFEHFLAQCPVALR